MSTKYSFDTGSFINPWNNTHPPDLMEGLWDKIGDLIKARTIVISEEVFIEIARQEDDLFKWISQYRQYAQPIDQATQTAVKAILKSHKLLIKNDRGKSGADPFVIATAMNHKCSVVTTETPGGATKVKIPNVCTDYQVECINFLEFLRREKLRMRMAV